MSELRRVAFRADASVVIGSGHVARCLTFADHLAQNGIDVVFVTRALPGGAAESIRKRGHTVLELPYTGSEADYRSAATRPESAAGVTSEQDAQETASILAKWGKPDLLILDHYSFTLDWEQQIESELCPVLAVSDSPNRQFASQYVFDHNPGANAEIYLPKMHHDAVGLFGPDFAWIDPKFTPTTSAGDRLLVFMGGADPDQATEKVLAACKDSGIDAGIDVIVGSQNQRIESIRSWCQSHLPKATVHTNADLPQLMKDTRLAIGAGGVSSLERAAMGIPTLCLTIAENQVKIAEALHQAGAHHYLGPAGQVTPESITEAIQSLWNDQTALDQQRGAGKSLIDTRGPSRTLSALTKPTKQIQIISDVSSWINDHLPHFTSTLQALGHTVTTAHSPADIQPADITLFLSCGQIVPPEKLALSKNNLVVHESDLPQGKGWSPLTWQILEGKHEIPVTLFEAAERVDSGVIYLQTTIKLQGHELVDELRKAQAEATFQLCKQFVLDAEHLIANAKQQQGEESFYKRRTPKHSEIDPEKSLAEQFDLLRVVDNQRYPAFFKFRGHEYVLKIEKRTKTDEQ